MMRRLERRDIPADGFNGSVLAGDRPCNVVRWLAAPQVGAPSDLVLEITTVQAVEGDNLLPSWPVHAEVKVTGRTGRQIVVSDGLFVRTSTWEGYHVYEVQVGDGQPLISE